MIFYLFSEKSSSYAGKTSPTTTQTTTNLPSLNTTKSPPLATTNDITSRQLQHSTPTTGNSYSTPGSMMSHHHMTSHNTTPPHQTGLSHSALNLATPDSSPLLTSPNGSSIASSSTLYSSPSPPSAVPVKLEPLDHGGHSLSLHSLRTAPASYSQQTAYLNAMMPLGASGTGTAVGAN